jgi:RNA polymerase sigma-70 factor (ECF subfamily)
MIDLEEHRLALFGIAYRMLGDRAEAEDVVQETFFKARDADAEVVASPRAWLSTVVMRLCLDHLKSARVRREQYVGPWLPEPLPTDAAVDRETISMAFMVLLETLSPIERAVFLLHDVFDYTHAEVAAIVQEQEATVRQILHRAKAHVVARRPRFSGTREQHALLLDGFIQACIAGDVEGLSRLLAADVVCYTDGGGKVVAATKPVRGAAETARFVTRLARGGAGARDATFDLIVLNGEMTLVGRIGGRVDTIVSIATDGERITEIDILRNPDKLARLAPS